MAQRLKTITFVSVVWAATAVAAQAEMTFRVVAPKDTSLCKGPCPSVIQAEGRITSNTPRRFVEFVKSELESGTRLRNIVLIHSPGGAVKGALDLGTVFRKVGATVVVAKSHQNSGVLGFLFPARDGQTGAVIPDGAITNAVCNSACVYAVMGGKNRVIPQQSKIGVHRMQTEVAYGYDPVSGGVVSQKINGTPQQVRALKEYARAMGSDARLIQIAESVPHDSIRELTPNEIRKYRLARTKM